MTAAILLLASALFGAGPGLDLPAVSRLAPVVVVGDVESVTFDATADGGRIYTEVRVKLVERLRGAAGLERLTLRYLGGQVGTRIAYLPGVPHFAAGTRVLLFLEPRKDGTGYLPVALADGVFAVQGERAVPVTEEAFGRLARPRKDRPGTARLAPIPIERVRAVVREARP